MSEDDPREPLAYLRLLAGEPASGADIERAIEQSRQLLTEVTRIWDVPAAAVPPAATYSADWDDELA